MTKTFWKSLASTASPSRRSAIWTASPTSAHAVSASWRLKGRPSCTLQVHPDDARRCGLADGGAARVRSRVGALELPVEVTDGIMPGVVSIPHGWGHDDPGIGLAVAAAHAGANSNLLADELALDPLSGNAVLNGISVSLEPVT